MALLAGLAGAAMVLAGCSQIAGLRMPAGAQEAEKGVAELRAGRVDRAQAEFDSAVKLAGSDYRTAAAIAGSCTAARQWSLATQYGEIAFKKTPPTDKPMRRELYAILSEAYLAQGNRDRAVQLAKQGYAEEPDEPGAMNNLGYIYADGPVMDKLGEALDLTQKAVRIATSEGRPEEETALYLDSVGWVKYQMGRIDEAIPDLTRASYVLPTQPDVLYHLGMAYSKKGRYADAIVVLERAVKLAPNDAEAEQALKEAIDKLPPGPSAPPAAPKSPASSGGANAVGPPLNPGAATLPAAHP